MRPVTHSADREPSVGQRQTSTGCVSSAAVQLLHVHTGRAHNVSTHLMQRDSAVMTSDQSERWCQSSGCFCNCGLVCNVFISLIHHLYFSENRWDEQVLLSSSLPNKLR